MSNVTLVTTEELSRGLYDARAANAELQRQLAECEQVNVNLTNALSAHKRIVNQRDGLRELLKSSESERDALAAQLAACAEALSTARVTIRAFHGVHESGAWEIYDKHSPEMRIINRAMNDLPAAARALLERVEEGDEDVTHLMGEVDSLEHLLVASESERDTLRERLAQARTALDVAMTLDRHYPEDVFTPLTSNELGAIRDALTNAANNGSDRLHASWARILVCNLRSEIMAALVATPGEAQHCIECGSRIAHGNMCDECASIENACGGEAQ